MENKKRSGKCPNTAFCSKGQNEEILEIYENEEFVCPVCKAQLEEIEEIIIQEKIIQEEIIIESTEEPTIEEETIIIEETITKEEPEEKEKGSKSWLTALIVALVTIAIIFGVFLVFKNKLDSDEDSTSNKTETRKDNVNSNTLDKIDPIIFNEEEMTVYVGETNRIPITINDIDAYEPALIWSSSNEDVIMINQDGIYYAQSPGTAVISVVMAGNQANRPASIQITVESEDGQTNETQSEEDDFVQQEVEPKPQVIETTPTTPVSTPTNKTSEEITIKGGNYTGDLLNGKPHGNGTIHYTSSVIVDDRDPQKVQAQVGDYFTGEFFNGRIVRGKLFDKNKELKTSIVLGRAAL